MHLIRVTDNELAREFVQLPYRLHGQAKWFARSQQKHLLKLIKRKAPFFHQGGDAEFWILTNFRGETIGRVAAFVINDASKGYIGLFDCINHLKAASLLFDQCKTWLQKFEIRAMEGPFSTLPFQVEGLSMDNKLQQSVPFVNIQSIFFTDLFEFYGFKNHQTHKLLRFQGGEKLLSTQQSINALEDKDYEILKVDKANISYAAEGISFIYNHSNHQQAFLSEEDLSHWLRLLFSLNTPPLIWLVYHDQQAIAVSINVFVDTPKEINEKEKSSFWHQITARFVPKHKSLLNLEFIVLPEYQNQEIEKGLLTLLDETISADPHCICDQFLILDEHINNIKSLISDGVVIDKFVKFKYKFDQEPLIDTFAKTKIISPE